MSEQPVIYLNNAATSWPKPACVTEAVQNAVRGLPPGQYRSAKDPREADLFTECRNSLGQLLGIRDDGRICFSSGSTESMNLILAGLGIRADQIITTVTEHNSVLRPLYNLAGISGTPVLLPCDRNGIVPPEWFEKEASAGNAKAVILNHCSNVTGAVQDAKAFGEIAKRYGMLFILDLSQSAGCMEIRVDDWQADAVAFTGHKSLLGITGTGGYYIREGVSYHPAKFGGTGRESEKLVYDGDLSWQNAGTQNTTGIAALAASCRWILQEGIGKIRNREIRLTETAFEELSRIRGIRMIGDKPLQRGPVISFTADQMEPSDLGYILGSAYGIVIRTGLHCSPLIHSYIGSAPKGTVRISFSPFNTEEDVTALAAALKEIL